MHTYDDDMIVMLMYSMATMFACQDGACLAGNQCSANRASYSTNPMCSICAPNHYTWGSDCVSMYTHNISYHHIMSTFVRATLPIYTLHIIMG